jgi:hypothetical protein
MMNHALCSQAFCQQRLLPALALMWCFSTAALGANIISGAVRNQSRGEPAAGADVIMLRLDGGIAEEARAKTDAQGVFTLEVQHPDRPYLVRVIHQGVSYDQQAFSGQSVAIEVFDVAARVRGISGTIEILRTGTNGGLLHVSDMVEIKNDSSPPLTQAGERTFEVYLPANAKIDSVLAAGPGKIGVMIFAAPVPGDPGHYTVSFPLRPGATIFAFNYDLPYHGRVAFQTKHTYALQQLAVMTPPAMKFSSRSPVFEILATGNSRYQVHAATRLQAGNGPEFEVSGTGALPPLGDRASSHQSFQSPAPPDPTQSPPPRASLSSLANIDLRWKQQARLPSQSLVLVGITSVLLAACVLLVWRVRKARTFSAAQTVAPRAGARQRSAA